MKKNIPTIKKSPLFQGIQDEDILSALRCLSPETRSYSKNEFVLHAGDSIDSVGLVLSGSVHVVNEDFWGNQNIIAEIGPGQVFAESYACMQGVTLGVSVFAAGAVTVLFLPVKNIMATCPTACAFHLRLIPQPRFRAGRKQRPHERKAQACDAAQHPRETAFLSFGAVTEACKRCVPYTL